MQNYNPCFPIPFFQSSRAKDFVPQFVIDSFNRGATVDREKLHDALFEQLGANPDDIEAALMIMVSANAMIVDQMNNLIDALLASQKEEGRDKYAYEKNYIEKNRNGQRVIKSVLTKARSLINENNAKLSSLVDNADNEHDFKYRVADAVDANDEVLVVMRKAMERYFYTKLATSRFKPHDIWATVDVLTTFALSDVAYKTYQYLTSKNAFPFIAKLEPFKFLSCIQFVQQIQKIIENINLLDENGKDLEIEFDKIFYSKELTALMDDFHRVLLSVEFVSNIFKVRDNLDIKGVNGCKSYVPMWSDDTYSINYYKLHYSASYPLNKVIRKHK